MATKRGKRPTKKVNSLKSKSLSASKAKGVRGGSFSFGIKNQGGIAQKVDNATLSRLYNK